MLQLDITTIKGEKTIYNFRAQTDQQHSVSIGQMLAVGLQSNTPMIATLMSVWQLEMLLVPFSAAVKSGWQS